MKTIWKKWFLLIENHSGAEDWLNFKIYTKQASFTYQQYIILTYHRSVIVHNNTYAVWYTLYLCSASRASVIDHVIWLQVQELKKIIYSANFDKKKKKKKYKDLLIKFCIQKKNYQ